MKKLFAIFTVCAFLATAPFAFADNQNGNGVGPDGNNGVAGILGNMGNGKLVGNAGFLNDDCDGDDCSAIGFLDLSAKTKDGAMDGGISTIRDGIAGGGTIAGGATQGAAEGFVYNGNITGSLSVVGGGIVSGGPYEWFDRGNGFEHGLGTWSAAEAVTGGYVSVNVDPGMNPALGSAGGYFEGVAGQATGNFSLLGESPHHHTAEGLTGGIAVQGSLGYIEGGVYAIAPGDNLYLCWCGYYHGTNNYAGASADAGVYQNGFTTARSWRGVEKNGEYRTEYMGTRTIAETHIDTWGYADHYNSGYWNGAMSGAWVDGGFIAGGLAANKTIMETENGIGKATAVGFYVGSGGLNCDFDAVANSKTNVSVTTKAGAKGSIIRSSAESTVTSNITNPYNGYQD